MSVEHKNQPLFARLRFALAGLLHGLRSENSLKFQFIVLGLVVAVLIYVHPAPLWWAIVLLACALVITAELVNTALEHLVDHVHPAIHPTIKIVKDCAAAAVLVASLGAMAIAVAFVIAIWKT
jgi:diacylglycerol kinase (ATP)